MKKVRKGKGINRRKGNKGGERRAKKMQRKGNKERGEEKWGRRKLGERERKRK